MKIIVCGAGEVGGHVAHMLSDEGSEITVVDTAADRLRIIADTMDVRTLEGNCAQADVLRRAGGETADLIIAATNLDEVNLLTASVGKGIGARTSIARVHHRQYFEQSGLDYAEHFGIDHLICPEYSTALAMARTLRNPAAIEIEHFSRGRIDMQEVQVTERAPVVDTPLAEVRFPPGARLAAVTSDGEVGQPHAETRLTPGDRAILVANVDVFDEARKQLRREASGRTKVVLMGGPPMAIWLCRELNRNDYSIRLFETDRVRAEELAQKLDWVTVINANPTEESVFAEEQIGMADAFVALLDDDEVNIIGCVLAKAHGVTNGLAVVQRSQYLDLLYHVGVDHPFSPGRVAARGVATLLDESPVRLVASVADGLGAYLVRVGEGEDVRGRELREVRLSGNWVITALQRGADVWVPGGLDVIQRGDSLLVVGRQAEAKQLRRLFVGN